MMLACIMRPLFREIIPNINLHIPIQAKNRTLKSNSYFLKKTNLFGNYILFGLFSDLKQSPIKLPLAIISIRNISHVSSTC